MSHRLLIFLPLRFPDQNSEQCDALRCVCLLNLTKQQSWQAAVVAGARHSDIWACVFICEETTHPGIDIRTRNNIASLGTAVEWLLALVVVHVYSLRPEDVGQIDYTWCEVVRRRSRTHGSRVVKADACAWIRWASSCNAIVTNFITSYSPVISHRPPARRPTAVDYFSFLYHY